MSADDTRDPGATKGPNVLFVICDQLRADHLGFAGNPVVQTPNIDALAARGSVFDRAWVNNPVCVPNRSTIMTGRMPSAYGVIFNDRSLPEFTVGHGLFYAGHNFAWAVDRGADPDVLRCPAPHRTAPVGRSRVGSRPTFLVGEVHSSPGRASGDLRHVSVVPRGSS